MKKILQLLLITITLLGCTKKEALYVPDLLSVQRDNTKVSLVAVGDNLIHNSIYEAEERPFDFRHIYSDIKPFINEFDLAFINQETILGGTELGLSGYPRFNSPKEIGDAIIDAGFNLFSIANNHTLDKGEIGVINALDYLDGEDIIYSGAKHSDHESSVKVFSKKGIKFGFVAYTYGTNGLPHPDGKEYLANVFSKEKAKEDIESVRDKVDIMIVSMHWGEQYQSQPNKNQVDEANYLSSLGVDIIIGHHPHVIQPIDIIETDGNKTIVIYSLGNFLSDQIGIDRLIGMAVSLEIEKNVDGLKTDIQIDNLSAKLTYRYKNDKFKILFMSDISEDILDGYLIHYKEKKDLINFYLTNIDVS
ncbi:CapA family protein [Mycoplasmatota bacterium zrk1]